jgi:hypothetical protein
MRAAMSTPGWRQRLTDMLEAGNFPLPGLVLAPAGVEPRLDREIVSSPMMPWA